MLPAEQGFGTAEPATGQVDLRLEMERELVLDHRFAKITLQTHPRLQAFVHLLGMRADGIATDGLGLVHGRVGVAQQRFAVCGIIRVEADADTGAGKEGLSGAGKRRGDQFA